MSRARDLANLHSSTDLNIDNNTFVVDKSENKIGIATTAPNAPLEIDGNASDDTTVELLRLSANQGVGQATNLIFKTRRDEDGGSALFSSIESARNDGGTTGLNLLLQPSGGNVGIGTNSPTSDGGTTLEIYNASTPTLRLNDGGDYKALVQLRGNDTEIRGSNGNMEFYTGNADGASSTNRMTISSSGLVTLLGTGKVIEAGGNKDFVIVKDSINTATSSSALSYMTINLNADLTCGAHITQVYSGVFGGIGYRYGVIETYVTRAQGGSYTINVKDSDGSGVLGVSGSGNVITLFYDTSGKSGSENAILFSNTTVKIATGNESLGTPTFTLT